MKPPGRSLVLRTLAVLALASVLVFLLSGSHPSWNAENLLEEGRTLPAPAFIAALFVLPLLGFPISLFLIVTGTRFGFATGFLLTALAMLFHHLVAFRLAHGFPRRWLLHRLERMGYKLPVIEPHHQVRWTAVFAAIYGPPYAAKLYLLALTNIPLRIYLWVGLPIYLLFAIPSIAVGHALGKASLIWITCILIVMLAIVPQVRKRLAKAGKG